MKYFNIPHYKSLVELKKRIDKVNVNNIEIAQKRADIINFYDKYGLEATKQAFKIGRTAIYQWKKILKENNNEIRSLIPLSRRNRTPRVSNIHPAIILFIKDYRMKYPRSGQYVIKGPLDEFCRQKKLKSISEVSIARVIRRLKDRGEIISDYKASYNARTGKIILRKTKRKNKERRKGYMPQETGDLVQIDSISIFKEGIKRYIITAVDLKSKFAFAYAYTNLSSRNARDFMSKLEYVAPFKIKRIQSDNGSEFGKYFDAYLKENRITHYYNYARRPQSNGCIERFNRTLRESFIDFSSDNIFYDMQGYQKELMEWLVWYNGEKRHRTINMTPVEYILKEKNLDPKKSAMYGYHTSP